MADIQLPNPFNKDAPHVPPPGISSKEWARLGVMGIIFLICVGGMVILWTVRKKKDPTKLEKKADNPTGVKDGKIGEAPDVDRKEGLPPAQNLEEKAAATLQNLRDGKEKIQKDQPEFLDFMYLMLSLSPQTVTDRVDGKIGAKDLVQEPKPNRGKYVRLQGRLIQLYTEPLEVTTTTGTRDVYLGVMQTYPMNLTIAFYLAERPKDPATGKDMEFKTKRYQGNEIIEDWVEIEGMFLRVWEYEGQVQPDGRSPTIKAPLIFAKNIRQKPPPEIQSSRKDFVWLIVGISAVVIGIVIFAGIVSRKYSKRSIRMEMHEVRKEKAKAAGAEIFPKPQPSSQVLGDEVKPPDPPAPTS